MALKRIDCLLKFYFICQMLNSTSVFLFLFLSSTHLLQQMDGLGHVLGNAKQIKHINNLKMISYIYCILEMVIKDGYQKIKRKKKKMAFMDRRKSK